MAIRVSGGLESRQGPAHGHLRSLEEGDAVAQLTELAGEHQADRGRHLRRQDPDLVVPVGQPGHRPVQGGGVDAVERALDVVLLGGLDSGQTSVGGRWRIRSRAGPSWRASSDWTSAWRPTKPS
jgi:hypothetical protein